MIAARDQAERSGQAVHALRGQLSDVPVRLELVWVDRLAKRVPEQVEAARLLVKGNKDILAVFWCDLGEPVRLYLFAPKQNRFLERSLAGSAPGEQMESIAVIVRTSVAALLAGRPIGKKPPPPPRPRPRPRPRARPLPGPVPGPRVLRRTARHRWMRMEAAYALEGYSTGVGAIHGLYAAVSVHVHRNWSVLADFRFVPEVEVEGRALSVEVEAKLNRYPVGVAARFLWPLSRFEVGGTLGLFMEYVKPKTPGGETGNVGSDKGAFLFGARPMAYGSVRMIWRVRAFLSAGVRFAFNRRRYVVKFGFSKETYVLTNPWPAQPLVLVGVCVDPF